MTNISTRATVNAHSRFSFFGRVLFVTAALAMFSSPAIAGNGLPEQASEIARTVTGELTIMVGDDLARGRAETLYVLKDKRDERSYQLRFQGNPPEGLKSGTTLTVRGRANKSEIYLAADDVSVELGATSAQSVASTASVVSGVQQTLVMVANFQDSPASCSVAQVRDTMFTDANDESVDDLYQEMSLGQVSFTGDVVGNYTIPFTSTGACEFGNWATALDAAASADGVDLSLYTRFVYVMPSENTCGYAGVGAMGVSPSHSWIMSCELEDVFAHELGHNLGMNHASTEASEYGDGSDIMGISGLALRQINAGHQEQMGWRAPEQFAVITESGTYDIAPLEYSATQALAPLALKIAKPDTGEFYYLSYRAPVGFDANLWANYFNKLHVHRYAGSANKTYLLSLLDNNQTFTDSANGISVTQVNYTPDYVTVQITLDGSAPPPPTCTVAAPTVSLSPSNQSSTAGGTVSYTVSIANNDSAACQASNFSLTPSTPTNWQSSLSAGSVSLAPGASTTVSLQVTSLTGAAASSYAIGVNVSDSSESAHASSASGSYTVVESCTAAALDLSLSPTSQNADPGSTLGYTVSLANNDSSVCAARTIALNAVAPAGWTAVITPAEISLAAGASGSATLTVVSSTTAAAAAYALQVSAQDTQNTISASAEYVVNAVSNADTTAPSTPIGLSAHSTQKQVSLTWSASSDNVGVAGYRVYRSGVFIGVVTATSFTDRDGSSGRIYDYSVKAFDAAGNSSSRSATVAAGKTRTKTKGGGKGKGPGK